MGPSSTIGATYCIALHAFKWLMFYIVNSFNTEQECGDEANSPLAPGFIDDYHFPMVADDVRNEMYFAALQKAIIPNKSRVLDVGAGTMLLSMMSMDLGAATVLGIEENPVMARIAREVLKANNYSDASNAEKIRLYEGKFENLRLGHAFLMRPADIMVSETFDAGLIGENFLSILHHAKSSGVLTEGATIIPNSGVIFGQLLESTFSLRRGRNNTAHLVSGRFNLEAMRAHRPSRVFTVRYLDEQNAVRQKLSTPLPLFQYDFQNYDISTHNFAYSCVVFKITQADEGVFDSIGLWFNLYLDSERHFVVSNAPEMMHNTNGQRSAPCWMQALYRVSSDMYVKRGDIVRLQVVQLTNTYIIGDVGVGEHNAESRLIKFITEGCDVAVEVYAFSGDPYQEIFDAAGIAEVGLERNQFLFGTIPACRYLAEDEQCYKVFSSRIYQLFKIVIRKGGKSFGMWHQLLDSTAGFGGTKAERASRKIPLDVHTITCPP